MVIISAQADFEAAAFASCFAEIAKPNLEDFSRKKTAYSNVDCLRRAFRSNIKKLSYAFEDPLVQRTPHYYGKQQPVVGSAAYSKQTPCICLLPGGSKPQNARHATHHRRKRAMSDDQRTPTANFGFHETHPKQPHAHTH